MANLSHGPQGEPLSDEERSALPEPEHAVIYGKQGEVIPPDSSVAGGTDRSVCALCGQELPDDTDEPEEK